MLVLFVRLLPVVELDGVGGQPERREFGLAVQVADELFGGIEVVRQVVVRELGADLDLSVSVDPVDLAVGRHDRVDDDGVVARRLVEFGADELFA